jgi:hypothetical protein
MKFTGQRDLTLQTPTPEELEKAHQLFEANEPRSLFYRAATELVELAMRGVTRLTVAEAVAVLLQSWNAAYYRFGKRLGRRFDEQHFLDIERILERHIGTLLSFRARSIQTFGQKDLPVVGALFEDFEGILGAVGAAKCLHLLAPGFFPLWDRAIAAAYGVALAQRGKNADRYSRFMAIAKEQCKALGESPFAGRNPLKALDEYNYVRCTLQLRM